MIFGSAYILTRDNYTEPTEEWAYRTQLFNQIYVPSIFSQAMMPHEVWLMGSLKGHAATLENHNVPCRLVSCGISGCRDLFRQTGESLWYWTVTIRVDNDDAIAPEFISTIMSQQADHGRYFCFPKGIYWDKMNGRCAIVHRTNNQFLARTERTDSGIATVYEHKHGHSEPITHIETEEPMWVWTIHADDERQMSNHSGSVRTALRNIPESDWQDESILERFGIQV